MSKPTLQQARQHALDARQRAEEGRRPAAESDRQLIRGVTVQQGSCVVTSIDLYRSTPDIAVLCIATATKRPVILGYPGCGIALSDPDPTTYWDGTEVRFECDEDVITFAESDRNSVWVTIVRVVDEWERNLWRKT